MADKRAALKELVKREIAEQQLKLKPQFSVEDYCFDKQIAFIRDQSRFKTAVCSRRSGKTFSCAADLIDTCLSFSDINCLYITKSRRDAKRIIWKDLQRINKKYDLKVKEDNVELSMTFSNGSTLYVSGATDESDIEKYRGMHIKKVYVDEAQSFPSYLEYFVEDILEPALRDYNGSLILTGTPGPVPAGYFYDCSHNSKWGNHAWTGFDNPFLESKSGVSQKDYLKALRERKGIDESDPTYQREHLGRWVNDSNSLVFKFSMQRNIYTELPDQNYNYIFGIDIGYEDSDAIAVLAYADHDPCVYLVEECITAKQTISDLVVQIKDLKQKYDPVKMVMDAGALGKKIQEEILQRHQLFIHAAEKQRKLEFIELLNDDLRTSKLKAFKNSRFSEDCFKVEWDKTNPERPKISDRFHSDINDAVLYSWKECRHYSSQPAIATPKLHSDQYMKELEEKEAAKMEESKKRTKMDDILGTQEEMDSLLEGIEDVYDDDYGY